MTSKTHFSDPVQINSRFFPTFHPVPEMAWLESLKFFFVVVPYNLNLLDKLKIQFLSHDMNQMGMVFLGIVFDKLLLVE